ncbi:hypothetical protein JG688_00014289 [Phytophthora aleatoria]|uniref:SWIM-type domain-containing protein n=1 Tax=Phytophthora aleatoria TaxID=2496075 RepID=A0A8J5IC37_9STRA|nr:hypothetical protein JG688_00014289 [Phytophthora aleatoria]
MVYLKDTTGTKQNDRVGEWEVSTRGQNYHCYDFNWTCTCLFSCSHNLPCHHIMYIAERVHRFENFPVSIIPQRWNMVAMSELEEEFSNGVKSLQIAQVTMKDAGVAYTHDALTQCVNTVEEIDATQDDDATQQAIQQAPQRATPSAEREQTVVKTTGARTQPKRRIIFVNMRRRERANVVVLSSVETYCHAKAVFVPVMEHLPGLASPAFFNSLKTWKNIV